jgi:hypothetical protein
MIDPGEVERRREIDTARLELQRAFPHKTREELDAVIKPQFSSEVKVVGEYSAADHRAAKRGSGDVIGPMNRKKGKEELKAEGMRTDNRYNDKMSLKVIATVQGCGVQSRQVVRVDREEKGNGKKGENRSTRDVRLVDSGKSNAGKGMQHAPQERGEEPSYILSLQSDGEGLEAYEDRDMDGESEGSKERHGKVASLREPSESQSGRGSDTSDDRVYIDADYKNGANRAKREKYENYGKDKEQEVGVNDKTPQSTIGYDQKFNAMQ